MVDSEMTPSKGGFEKTIIEYHHTTCELTMVQSFMFLLMNNHGSL